MLKSYDTVCEDCGEIIEQFVESYELFKDCPICSGVMKRMHTTMNYKLLYNNKKDICGWGDTGYATSQYWSKVKAEREKGNKVKAVNED